jgi:hypothetical protein
MKLLPSQGPRSEYHKSNAKYFHIGRIRFELQTKLQMSWCRWTVIVATLGRIAYELVQLQVGNYSRGCNIGHTYTCWHTRIDPSSSMAAGWIRNQTPVSHGWRVRHVELLSWLHRRPPDNDRDSTVYVLGIRMVAKLTHGKRTWPCL